MKAQELSGRQLLVDVGPVGYEPERTLCAFRVRRDVVAIDDDAAGGRLEETGNHSNRRGLASAVRSEETMNLAGADVEIDPVDGHERAVLFLQILNGDHS